MSEINAAERQALEHAVWLARERRHTDDMDRDIALAIRRGWVSRLEGIMGDIYQFRVQMTAEGTLAARRAGVRGA